MKLLFDPVEARRILDSDVGYRLNLSSDFEYSKRVGGLASSAHADLNTAVQCLLIGYDRIAGELLRRAFDWLVAAINEQEKPRAHSPNGTEALRYWDLAMCNWLLSNTHDADSLRRFVECEDQFLNESRAGRDKVNISLTLIGYVDAGACQQALERAAAVRIAPPRSLSSIRTEGQMCCVICQHRLAATYLENEVNPAIERFLRRSINAWLCRGLFLRAAEWMKVVHWQSGVATAKDAVLHCFRYLEGLS